MASKRKIEQQMKAKRRMNAGAPRPIDEVGEGLAEVGSPDCGCGLGDGCQWDGEVPYRSGQ